MAQETPASILAIGAAHNGRVRPNSDFLRIEIDRRNRPVQLNAASADVLTSAVH